MSFFGTARWMLETFLTARKFLHFNAISSEVRQGGRSRKIEHLFLGTMKDCVRDWVSQPLTRFLRRQFLESGPDQTVDQAPLLSAPFHKRRNNCLLPDACPPRSRDRANPGRPRIRTR